MATRSPKAPRAPMPLVARVVAGGICVVVGVGVMAVGILRPAGMWAMPKIQNGVKVIGDAGVSALLVTLGITALAGAAFIFLKR